MRIVLLAILIIFIAGCINQNESTDNSFCKGTDKCFSGIIAKVTDGDTLEVNNISIRLTLIDAPESYDVGGNEAREFALSICPIGSTALVDVDDGQPLDKYNRTVAVVYCNNKNLNAEMLANYYATLYRSFCDVSEFANENWTGC